MDKSMRLTIFWTPEAGGHMSIHDGIATVDFCTASDWLSGFDSKGRQVMTARLDAINAWEHREVLVPFPGEMIPVDSPGHDPRFTTKRP